MSNCLPKWLQHSAFPPGMYEHSYYSTTSPEFSGESVLDFGNSNRNAVVSHCCFNLHFLMTYIVDHLFIIYISSLVKYLLKSMDHFLNGLFVS